jgi:hypothetical protein
MKKLWLITLMLCLICSSAFAAKIGLSTVTTGIMPVKLESNADVSALCFSVTGLPIASVTCSDANKVADFNAANGRILVSGMNSTVAANGNIVTVTFTLPQPYGTYPIVITPLSATTGLAVPSTVIKGADGIIAITFSVADIAVEKDAILGKNGATGMDLIAPTGVDCSDLQTMINNKG